LSFELPPAVRRIKPQRRSGRLLRRADHALSFLNPPVDPGLELMLDTCVYIDVAQGRTPPDVDELLTERISNHSAICLAELTHLFGRLDPDHPETATALARLETAINRIPLRRLTSPSIRALGEAGMLAGLVARLGGLPQGRAQALLNDAILYLHAIERGCIVLTRNLREFDFFDQILPYGRVLFYRRSD
jgi:predicted nucleic acid-binding protein